MSPKAFYTAVADLLRCEDHVYREFPYLTRTRWNNRAAGNGRYPGFGIVRMFGPTCIVVSLKTPALRGQFNSPDAALQAITQAYRASAASGIA